MKAITANITLYSESHVTLEFFLNGSLLTAQQVLDIFEELASKDDKHYWGFVVRKEIVTIFRPPIFYNLVLESPSCLRYETAHGARILEWLPPRMYSSFTERAGSITVKIVKGEEIVEKNLAFVLTSSQ
jgi:hypothetical protein